jgi:hypothetical protein
VTDEYTGPERRSDGTRLALLEDRVKSVRVGVSRVEGKVDNITALLNASISEPAATPLGRAQTTRADENRGRINEHETRLRELEERDHQRDGAEKLTRQIQLVLGIALGVLTLLEVASRN